MLRRHALEREPRSSSQLTAYLGSRDDLLYDLLPRRENQQKWGKPNYWSYENWNLICLELRRRNQYGKERNELLTQWRQSSN